ncbi:MAG: hypothetical protein H9535_14265 [Ignavibacteria bacterium]|nr:hypothetical protein [Ignavibacteria bacterium]
MKNLLHCIVTFLFCVLLLSVRVEAQPKQGQFMVGGFASLSYSYSDYNAFYSSSPLSSLITPYTIFSSNFRVSIGPSLGYFVSDNIVLGCQIIPSFYTNSISISYSSSFSSRSSGSSSYLSIAVSPFVRYFFPEIGAKIYPFATVGLGFQPSPLQLFSTGNVGTISSPVASYSGTIGAGLAWFFNPNTSIEPIISYNLAWGILGEQIIQKSGSVGLGVGWQIYLRSLAPEGGN